MQRSLQQAYRAQVNCLFLYNVTPLNGDNCI